MVYKIRQRTEGQTVANAITIEEAKKRSTAFQHSFFVEAIESWNNLHFDVSTLSSLSPFKFLLKQKYLS